MRSERERRRRREDEGVEMSRRQKERDDNMNNGEQIRRGEEKDIKRRRVGAEKTMIGEKGRREEVNRGRM
jgi:hypothetical protein